MLRRIRNQRGLTLIEMMIALAVGSIVMLAIGKIFTSQSLLYSGERKVTHLFTNAKIYIQRLTKLIRHLGYNPMENTDTGTTGDRFGLQGQSGETVTLDTAIYFTADMDEDGVLASTISEDIRFNWDSATNQLQLYNPATATWDIFAENITNFGVAYTYDDGTESSGTTDLPTSTVAAHTFDKVRMVTITLTAEMAEVHSLTKTKFSETVTTTIKLRNNTDITEGTSS